MYKTQHFLMQWRIASSQASYFKTDATKKLDKDFEAHANRPPCQQSDSFLKFALDDWLKEKKDANSSRYELVLSMREHIQDVIYSYPTQPTSHQSKSM